MKKIFTFLTMLFFLTAIPTQGQINILKDTLIKKTSISSFSGKTTSTTSYYDTTTSYDDLPRPKDAQGKIPEAYSYDLNSNKKLTDIAQTIFDHDELIELIESKCSLICISLSTDEIVSASFMFLESEPEISMAKMVEFSNQIKENLTITVTVYPEIVEEGYISSYYSIFHWLRKELK